MNVKLFWLIIFFHTFQTNKNISLILIYIKYRLMKFRRLKVILKIVLVSQYQDLTKHGFSNVKTKNKSLIGLINCKKLFKLVTDTNTKVSHLKNVTFGKKNKLVKENFYKQQIHLILFYLKLQILVKLEKCLKPLHLVNNL